MFSGPGHADVEEAALLLDLLVGLGVGDRHHALGDPDQEHGVPLQALGRVQRGEGDALHGRGVLGARPLVELGDEVGEGRARLRSGEVLREVHQRGQRLPALPDGPGAGRAARVVQPSPESTARTWEGRSTTSSRRESLPPKRAAARSALIALRTSGRSKNRSAPRSW